MSDNTLPAHARVVIIGGGVIGCSVAYHLTQLGWRDVVLLERAQLTRHHLACRGPSDFAARHRDADAARQVLPGSLSASSRPRPARPPGSSAAAPFSSR